MKLQSLRISNILSFAYHENIENAPQLLFSDGIHILIGPNGSGKSTALEVLNFFFRRILFQSYHFNLQAIANPSSVYPPDRIKTIAPQSANTTSGFRLQPNWDTPNTKQEIQISVILDELDQANLSYLHANKVKLDKVAATYSQDPNLHFVATQRKYNFNIVLNPSGQTFQVFVSPATDPGFMYLQKYHFYKELIHLHNLLHSDDQLEPLREPYSLIVGYRNYHTFTPGVSLQQAPADQQIAGISQGEYNKSMNAAEPNEPLIFNLVRLKVANAHFESYGTSLTEAEAEKRANEQEFLLKINAKLRLIALEVKVHLTDKRNWTYSFHFYDTRRKEAITDINILSAGQKAIVHLIFEAYGRGELSGGVMIIDEPEIHLHYQFQLEYLRVIDELITEKPSQYILVTHSESLINSSTIGRVKRFTMNRQNHTLIASPKIQEDQKTLIKILDNSRTTYAFFAKKVLLVEGDSDRYFYRAALDYLYPHSSPQIAVLDMGGKSSFPIWKQFFEGFGLPVAFIGDFDNMYTLRFAKKYFLSPEKKAAIEERLRQQKLDTLNDGQKESLKKWYNNLIAQPDFLDKPTMRGWKPLTDHILQISRITQADLTREVQREHPELSDSIVNLQEDSIFILRQGSLEAYTGTSHGNLAEIVRFCDSQLIPWLDSTEAGAVEIRSILDQVVKM